MNAFRLGLAAVFFTFCCDSTLSEIYYYVLEESCSESVQTISLETEGVKSAVVIKSQEGSSYNQNCDSKLELSANQGTKLTVSFNTLQLPLTEDCYCQDYLDILYLETLLTRFCGFHEKEFLSKNYNFTSENKNIILNWHSDDEPSTYQGAEITVTAYRIASQGNCGPNERRCSNNRCIDPRWFCDGRNNCGDFSDESSCTSVTEQELVKPDSTEPDPDSDSSWKIHVGVIVGLVAFVTLAGLSVWFIRRRRLQKNQGRHQPVYSIPVGPTYPESNGVNLSSADDTSYQRSSYSNMGFVS